MGGVDICLFFTLRSYVVLSLVSHTGGGDYPVENIQEFLDKGEFTTFFEHSTSGMINLYDGMYLWSVSDKRLDAITSLMSHGEPVKVYLEASYTPRWMSGWYSSDSTQCVNNSPERDEWYSDLVSATVSRYRTGGIYGLSNGIAGIGLWNEPDGCGALLPSLPQEQANLLDSRPAMIRYGEIASLAADAIRDIDPTIEIISGGFSSPSVSLATSSYGWQGDVYYKMQPMFSGENTIWEPPSPYPVKRIVWNIMPTALHWHPYRGHTENGEYAKEWYDPLVIDSEDLMFRNRPGNLPLFLNEILVSASFPLHDWTQMRQYAMEYCPIYALTEWGGVEPDWWLFYTEWRANYFITANLMLLETNDMDLLAPYPASADKWWVPAEGGGWHNIEYIPAGLETYADYAYIHMSNQLSGKYCLDVNETIVVPNGRVSVWEFNDELSFRVGMIALRTRRDDPDTAFDYDEMHTVQIAIPAGVTGVVHTGIRGDELSDVVINNGSIDVDVNGYVSYIELFYTEQDQMIPTQLSEVEWAVSSSSITAISLSNNVRDRLIIFDMSGRITEMIEGVSVGPFREFYWNWIESQKPNGIYFASFSRVGDIIDTRKVVVLK